MESKYILDADGNPVPEPDVIAWANWFEKADYRVASSRCNDGTIVSTVFLGLDHNFMGGEPLLWETMTFPPSHTAWDGFQLRYSTREHALEAHKMVVTAINEGKTPEQEAFYER